jgi:hypothetical protein
MADVLILRVLLDSREEAVPVGTLRILVAKAEDAFELEEDTETAF